MPSIIFDIIIFAATITCDIAHSLLLSFEKQHHIYCRLTLSVIVANYQVYVTVIAAMIISE
jgi:hypothetical protein